MNESLERMKDPLMNVMTGGLDRISKMQHGERLGFNQAADLRLCCRSLAMLGGTIHNWEWKD